MRSLAKLNCLFLIAIPFLLMGLGSATCSASPGVRGPYLSSSLINSGFTFGDFDGDGLLDDVALVRVSQIGVSRAVYNVSIHMGSGVTQDLSFEGPRGPFAILQRDVTGNGTPDLVLAAPWLDQPLGVLVNLDNGKGTFRVANPAAYPAANKVQVVPVFESQATLDVHTDTLSAQRILPLDNEGRGRIPLPGPLLASRFMREISDAGRLLLVSHSGRAPPRSGNIS
ncbi:MAG: hypothetical protein WCA19_17380 [Candidatus Acidiferrales bacterium]